MSQIDEKLEQINKKLDAILDELERIKEAQTLTSRANIHWLVANMETDKIITSTFEMVKEMQDRLYINK